MMDASAAKVRSTGYNPTWCRIQSQLIFHAGQQVTGYPHEDVNNHWQVLPTKALPENGRGRVVRNQDVVQLRHVTTETDLLSHDVASPLMPTNQEFTTLNPLDRDRYNDTLFTINIVDGHAGQPWKTKSSHFRLVHLPTKVALWTHPETLPDWAFNQQEINGNKNLNDRSTTWFVDEIIEDECRFLQLQLDTFLDSI